VETQSRETYIEDTVIKFTQRMRCGDKHLRKMDAIPSGEEGLSSGYKAARKDQVSNFQDGRQYAWKS
jgi:hypothetical protein